MSDKAPSPSPAPKEPTPAPVEDAPAETKPESKPTSSTKKAVARPKGRQSGAGGSKKVGNGNAGDSGDKSFSVGDIVLARLKGYPPWPARIADPDSIPDNVNKQKHGKSTSSFCCHFFPAGDYSWLQSREISHLSKSDIEAYVSGGKGGARKQGELYNAYTTAQDPSEWLDAQKQLAEDRAKRNAEAEVDELDGDEDGGASGGKRKRAEPAKKSHKKKAKVEKSKSEVAESEEEEAPKSKSKAKATKAKATPAKNAKKSETKAAPAEDKATDDDPLASDPECVKVKDWRHRLQRAFLGKGLPSSEEMGAYDALFKTIEEYQGITIEALQYSKIGKVMKKIATLEAIPRDDELRITDRASKLMNEWSDFIGKNEGKSNGNGDAAANGNGEASEKAELEAEVPANGETEKMETDE